VKRDRQYSSSCDQLIFVTQIIARGESREVTTLANQVQQAGIYEVKFNGSNLPSGAYFYRLQAGSYSATKKILLLK
jgi:hypothetical protein